MTKDEFLSRYKVNYKYASAPFPPGILIESIEDLLNSDAKNVVYFYKDDEGIANISVDIEEEYISSSINIIVNTPIEKIVFVPFISKGIEKNKYTDFVGQLKIQKELV